MATKGEIVVGGVVVLTLVAAEIYLANQATKAGELAQGAAGISIAGVTPSPWVRGSSGNKVTVTVTNNSVYTGTTTKAPFTFNMLIQIQIPDGNNVTWGSNLGSLYLAAGATGTYTFTFSIPSTATPGAGKVYAFVKNPADPNPFAYLASATPLAVTLV